MERSDVNGGSRHVDATETSGRLCVRCRVEPQVLIVRSEGVCNTCYTRFISTKAIKRLEALHRLLRLPHGRPAKCLVGLSFGTSSTVMLHVIDENLRQRSAKGRQGLINPVVVHVDTGLASETELDGSPAGAVELVDKYRKRYPDIEFQSISLSTALKLQAIDWSALPRVANEEEGSPEDRLQAFLNGLPSNTSRLDIVRLFTRHILISAARQQGCHAVLLGCSTTALAELTLSETAQGRGGTAPWLIDDGSLPLVPERPAAETAQRSLTDGANGPNSDQAMLLYYPLRDVFRKELATFAALTEPPLTNLIRPSGDNSGAVISHKDLGIQDIMARYFDTVEEQYPSLVANVVRTATKLRREEGTDVCSLCGLGLNPAADRDWNGEVGEQSVSGLSQPDKLCYGCRRTLSS